ncbi:MAG: large subunit ribosomal protein [Candidatus Dependentiae bacterium]|nr:large subunit ribosomal protein [Candidatus Dependentiae bacterium]
MKTLSHVPGIKVGMTQVFDDARNVIPVTVIECGQWIITQIKTVENDGYNALQIGKLRKRFQGDAFTSEMLEKKSMHFLHIREVRCESTQGYELGAMISLDNVLFEEKMIVSVTGVSTGRGFQGVVKRLGYTGGPATHGSMFGRRPGAIGSMRTQGEVIKGKGLPGHHGDNTVTTRGLRVVKVDRENGVILVKGAVPGRKNSLLYLSKQG